MALSYINDLQDLQKRGYGYFDDRLENIKSALLCALAGNYFPGDKNAALTLKKAVTAGKKFTHSDECLWDAIDNVWYELDMRGMDALDDWVVRKDIYTLITAMY